ncbi:hypothetical protein CBF45_06465 [Bordetella sp. J329]|jgi:multicomponent K+:H+ antiporter subunit G|uniref:monovalent cation/H(+) antiporter subunit G n=1 Tax=Kerstersia gyiorum TaxID=206506 RepID=UPI000FD8329C|nr:monovalent cation/H(+) antiporter subunit G [Kerstersia gyiorum]AZV93406.1 hypothetical protein CBF45_06465 [Bordetella sp. J329]MCH4272901.1 monovalent cation/H(+) antiporter subunit G [Kerstersia gyiorum]MCI1229573.1 monovalent cation/H(+) antiporter subunit G [Kerstersia gyiorum]
MTESAIGTAASLLIAFLLVAGGLLALIGSIGLLRLRNFYQRLHAPTLGNTLGCGCILVASILYFSLAEGRIAFHEVLITLFIVMTAPLGAMLLSKVALYRDGREARLRQPEQSEPTREAD